jgi:hypothetical protein
MILWISGVDQTLFWQAPFSAPHRNMPNACPLEMTNDHPHDKAYSIAA